MPTFEFQVPDMTCGHCVASVTRAVQALDAAAELRIDLAQHHVAVASSSVNAQQVQAALEDAGYTPAPWPTPTH